MSKIRDRFCEIFPFVEDFKVELVSDEDIIFDTTILIKEKDVEKWIPQKDISSGMFRTLYHIAELYLCPEGTIFLIDEFENSLGVNCMDEITEDLNDFLDRKLQFIITSHHPYIINNIYYDNWKLVSRQSSKVKAQNITDLIDFNKSKHDAFMQLIQLNAFQTGMTETPENVC